VKNAAAMWPEDACAINPFERRKDFALTGAGNFAK
jgi:hypothetical protein